MRKRIIILEDEKDILEVIQFILEEEGYDVIAFNHFEPLEEIIEYMPDLILLDVRLSDGYGHLLCSQIKANSSTSDLPVILVSGADNLEKIAKEYGADNFLSKPFDLEDLKAMVKQYI
ncbi:MAG: response regulator [Mucilaginibacter sp.]